MGDRAVLRSRSVCWTPRTVRRARRVRRVSNAQYELLRERLGRLWDLVKLGGLGGWDQQTMMPPQGAGVRARQLATVSLLVHDLLVSDELGSLLAERRPYGESLDYDSDEAS